MYMRIYSSGCNPDGGYQIFTEKSEKAESLSRSLALYLFLSLTLSISLRLATVVSVGYFRTKAPEGTTRGYTHDNGR